MSTLSHDDKTPEQPADGDKVFLRDISDTGTGINDGIIVATVDLLGQTIIAGRGAEIKTQYEAQADTNAFTNAEQTKLAGIAEGAEVNPDVVSQAEAEAGIATTERIWTAERIAQAIAALGGGGGGGGSLTEGNLRAVIAALTAAAPDAADTFGYVDADSPGQMGQATAQQIVEQGNSDLGIVPQNRISVSVDPSADDDGAGTNGINHLVNDLWTNTTTDTSWICQDITTGAAVWAQIDAAGGGGAPENLVVRFSNGVSPVNVFQASGTAKLIEDAAVYKYDLSNYTQARLRCYKDDADPGYKFGVRYKTGNPTLTLGDYGVMAATSTEIELDAATAGYHESSWFDLDASAQAEVSFAFVGLDITASTNASVHYYEVEFRQN